MWFLRFVGGFVAGEKGEEEAVGGFYGRDLAEEVRLLGHENLQIN